MKTVYKTARRNTVTLSLYCQLESHRDCLHRSSVRSRARSSRTWWACSVLFVKFRKSIRRMCIKLHSQIVVQKHELLQLAWESDQRRGESKMLYKLFIYDLVICKKISKSVCICYGNVQKFAFFFAENMCFFLNFCLTAFFAHCDKFCGILLRRKIAIFPKV